jgi:TetR/AcrR family transcriptional regulator, mexJK operon transcriptional repressor
MSSSSQQRFRGRPKDPDKRAAIMRAAKRLFSRHGLTGVSMDAIAELADVSKLTLYSHFRGKDELFQTAVAEKCQEHTPPDFFDSHTPLPLRERLRAIGHGFVGLVMSKEALDLYRMMAAQAGGASRLGKLFFAAGPERNLERFSALLEHADAAGELQVPDARRAAGHFFCLLQGVPHLRVIVGESKSIPPRELRAHVDDVVEIFLRAYRRDR